MAKKIKKGTSGQAKSYITRSQAVRKLQITLTEFRKLCIFKGIYPREPPSHKKVSKSSTPSTTFYYTKDIQYLLHEPLIQKFRDHKALAKKVSRALGKGEAGEAARLKRLHTPRIKLDHIIKERYPTFTDALRDLDDALSMLYLFANLPASTEVPTKTIARCQRLCHEFEHYLIMTHSVRKSFLSIKGIYYQATIEGQDILWLVPYQFVQQKSADIDFRIMSTFLEFYTTLLSFVNYRLYKFACLVYPPKFDSTSDERGGQLDAFSTEFQDGQASKGDEKPSKANNHNHKTYSKEATAKAQAIADSIVVEANDPKDDDVNDDSDSGGKDIEPFPKPIDPSADVLPVGPSQHALSTAASKLFKPFVFYLSRETPRAPLEFLLKAFGCPRVGWGETLGAGAFTHDENDPRITHQIVDRPPMPPESPTIELDSSENDWQSPAGTTRSRIPGRTYIQPQWIWDSINQGKLARPDLYAPGSTLPPHLSPWVKPESGSYDPATFEAGDVADLEELSEDEGEHAGSDEASNVKKISRDQRNATDATSDWSGLSGEESEQAETSRSPSVETEVDDEHSELNENQPLDEEEAYQRSIELEAAGVPPSKWPANVRDPSGAAATTSKSQSAGKKAKTNKSSASSSAQKSNKDSVDNNWELERRKMMMPRKKRKLYEKMVHGNRLREEESEKLRAKRRKIEKEKSKAIP